MRLFELLLLLPLLPFIFWPIIAPSRPRWVSVLAITAVFPLIIHLFTEQYRWQMMPAYGLTFLVITAAIFQLRAPHPAKKRWLSIVFSLFGLAWAMVAFFLPTALPVPVLPSPTGAYNIGTATYYLVDSSREESATAIDGDNRELMAQVWYPAVVDENSTPAPYMEEIAIRGKAIAEQYNLPPYLFDHLNLVESYAYLDVPVAPADAPYPVILFSHGLTGVRGQNRAMINELVSNGYIVAAVGHSYANALTIFPDGRVIFYDPNRLFRDGIANPQDGNALVQVWADDLAFLLDTLTAWQNESGHLLAGAMDVSRVGVFGHSTGGGATLEFCMKDGRCQAGVPLDSWVLPVSDSIFDTPPIQPFLFMSTPLWLGKENQQRGEAIIDNLPNTVYQLTIADTVHTDFSDMPLMSPFTEQLGLSGSIDSMKSSKIQNAYLLAFFDRYLKGNDAGLLDQPSPYPQVTIERQP